MIKMVSFAIFWLEYLSTINSSPQSPPPEIKIIVCGTIAFYEIQVD